MNKNKTSLFTNGLIWFGAGVSISEILTGTYLAPLGLAKGLLAVIIGHIIGCTLFCLAGIIGGKTEKSSMETVKMSFGQKGSLLFSVLNIIQLVGWTAVMIANGASAASTVIKPVNIYIWCAVICVLIIVWLFIGTKNASKLNYVAMGLLFVLTIILSVTVFKGTAGYNSEDTLSFGAAVELAVAMPLSWLPLISDYTREAKEPVKASVTSSIVYFIISSWMYAIGLGAALFTGESDIAVIMLKSGLGIAAMIIIILSTVTTTFLDVYSAGVSSVSVFSKIKERQAAIVVCVIGTVIAMFTKTESFESFLYFISSVFVPMIAVQLVDYFILKNDSSGKGVNVINLIVWLIGFCLYRASLNVDIITGNTLPVMVITSLLCFALNKIFIKEK